jgi:deoxyribodipyrimidine photo-lyase
MSEKIDPLPTLFWFNQDLRLDDNPALAHAAAHASELTCVYCHDPWMDAADDFGIERQGPLRKRFIAQSLAALASSLEQSDQALLQVEGPPVAMLQELIGDHRIQRVVRSRQFGVYENRQWERLRREYTSIEFIEIDSYTLLRQDQVATIGQLPRTFNQFRRRAEHIAKISPAGKCQLPPSPAGVISTAPEAGPGAAPEAMFAGGEAAASAHVSKYFEARLPSTYKKTRNALDGWSHSSKMSPWLATGCLSVRRLYQRLRQYEISHGANESTYWLYFELLWREFFQWYAHEHRERLFLPGGITGGGPSFDFDAGRFDAWCTGETQWPLVNACMKQLNQTGYLSNRARQIAASALINELNLDWRCGAAYFEKQLVDYDVGSNWGNWQYIAGVGADARGGRHFSIEKQARQFDADGSYVDRWLGRGRQQVPTGAVA